MFGSTVLGCAAGLLMALDGMHFVLSRTALLDIFLMFFILAAFGALVLDRDQRRRRWLRVHRGRRRPARPGPGQPARRSPCRGGGWPPRVLLGCALGVKWSAPVLPARHSCCWCCWWEVGARRSAGVRRPIRRHPPRRDRLAARSAGRHRPASTWRPGPAGSSPTTATSGTGCATTGSTELPVLGRAAEPVALPPRGVQLPQRPDQTRTPTSPGRGSGCCWAGRSRSTGPATGPAAPPAARPRCCCSARRCCGGRSCRRWRRTAWFGIARRDWRAGAILVDDRGRRSLPWFYYVSTAARCSTSTPCRREPFLILAVVYVLGAIMTPPPGSPPGRRTDRHWSARSWPGTFVLLVALTSRTSIRSSPGSRSRTPTGRRGCGSAAAGSSLRQMQKRPPSSMEGGR